MKYNLRERFKRDIGNSLVSLDNLYDEIEQDYTTDRHYHDLRHISNCLDFLDCVAHDQVHVLAVKAAIYYHDIVYDSKAKDNEEQSADIAALRLEAAGYRSDFCERVREIIMATKHTGNAVGPEQQLMCDIDLAELGADWMTFVVNNENIRQEFSWVTDEKWREGRGQFLGGMLARPKIFYTRPFEFLFEAKARENLSRAINMLDAA